MITLAFVSTLIVDTIGWSAPVILVALGGLFTYHAGIFNIAMEGMMLSGAFGAVAGAHWSGTWIGGVVGGIVGSGLLALLYDVFVVRLGTDEFVTGIAINLGSLGGTTFLLRRLFDVKGSFNPRGLSTVPRIVVPVVKDIPVLGSLVSGHTVLDLFAPVAVAACGYVLYRTRYGLRVRSAGAGPAALAATGVDLRGVRSRAVWWCGVACGLGGAAHAIGYLRGFGENTTSGRGWIALAAIVLARGRPIAVAGVCALFAAVASAGLASQDRGVPTQLADMAPYIAVLAALFFETRRRSAKRPKSIAAVAATAQ